MYISIGTVDEFGKGYEALALTPHIEELYLAGRAELPEMEAVLCQYYTDEEIVIMADCKHLTVENYDRIVDATTTRVQEAHPEMSILQANDVALDLWSDVIRRYWQIPERAAKRIARRARA